MKQYKELTEEIKTEINMYSLIEFLNNLIDFDEKKLIKKLTKLADSDKKNEQATQHGFLLQPKYCFYSIEELYEAVEWKSMTLVNHYVPIYYKLINSHISENQLNKIKPMIFQFRKDQETVQIEANSLEQASIDYLTELGYSISQIQ